MKKVVNTYFSDKLSTQLAYFSGLVYELDDGRFIIHAQDGAVMPSVNLTLKDKEEVELWADKHIRQANDDKTGSSNTKPN